MDWCDFCDGIWLEPGELTHLTQTADDLPSLPGPAKAPTKSRRSSHPHCPRCRLRMEETPYAQGQNLLIDRCPRCRGIWLKRGELQAIYDHLAKRPANPSAAAPAASDSAGRLALGIVLLGLLLVGLLLFLLKP